MRGASLVLLLFLLAATLHYSRWALPERNELPAVVRLRPLPITVIVADNIGNYGLYQFNDGSSVRDVIKLTQGETGKICIENGLNDQPIIAGEFLKVSRIEGDCVQVERSWLSARHRMLMQIPLHPDRMSIRDWEALPGIGPSLAQAIENERQNNGDYYEFVALERVKGIGSKKLEGLKEYFQGKNDQ